MADSKRPTLDELWEQYDAASGASRALMRRAIQLRCETEGIRQSIALVDAFWGRESSRTAKPTNTGGRMSANTENVAWANTPKICEGVLRRLVAGVGAHAGLLVVFKELAPSERGDARVQAATAYVMALPTIAGLDFVVLCQSELARVGQVIAGDESEVEESGPSLN